MLFRRILKKNFSSAAVLPDLAFDYGDLKPVMSAQMLELHHSVHHQGYVNNFNNTLEQLNEASEAGNFGEVQRLGNLIKFYGGGHVNHALFWENLAPASREGGVLPDANSDLTQAINAGWGSLENFMTTFDATTAAILGSGWGTLVLDPTTNALKIETRYNQDMVSDQGYIPLLTIDVWEHAYYLDYRNRRTEYLNKIWDNVNWKVVESRFNDALN